MKLLCVSLKDSEHGFVIRKSYRRNTKVLKQLHTLTFTFKQDPISPRRNTGF